MCEKCVNSNPFQKREIIRVGRTDYLVLDSVQSAVPSIFLVDLRKVKDDSLHVGRYSSDVKAFLNILKKKKDQGPTRLAALFEIGGNGKG